MKSVDLRRYTTDCSTIVFLPLSAHPLIRNEGRNDNSVSLKQMNVLRSPLLDHVRDFVMKMSKAEEVKARSAGAKGLTKGQAPRRMTTKRGLCLVKEDLC